MVFTFEPLTALAAPACRRATDAGAVADLIDRLKAYLRGGQLVDYLLDDDDVLRPMESKGYDPGHHDHNWSAG